MQNVGFVEMLMEMRNGKVAVDCSKKLDELLGSIQETNKPGKIALTIQIAPSRVESGSVKELTLVHECKITKPERPIGNSVFYLDSEGKMTRTDPDQAELFPEEEIKNAGR